MLDRLSERYSIDAEDRIAARAAALLHDVGHGSFSHVMEKVLNFHHEQWTVQVLLSEETEIGQLLRSHSADLPNKVASIIEGKFQPSALAQLVSSQLDVDRMDYLLRDSLMTGAKYGIYDLEWIINALAIDEDGRSNLRGSAWSLCCRGISAGSLLHVSTSLLSSNVTIGRSSVAFDHPARLEAA